MEQFKKELQASCRFTAVLSVILAVFSVLGFAAEAGLVALAPVGGGERWQSIWRGLVSGGATGVLAVMLAGLVRSLRALKDEKKLRKLYVESRDERQLQIWTSARASAMRITLLAGLVAGLIVSYFHVVIGVTILALEFIHALTCLACKLYYSKKF